MCGAPRQSAILPPGTDLTRETVILGTVERHGSPLGGAYVRLLDASGEFTAEVQSSATGDFRFFATPGSWTVSAVHRTGSASRPVEAERPGLVRTTLTLD